MSVKDMLFGSDSGLKNKYSSRGVSPVIGVILMVVITVILAGVVAVSFMGFGDQVDEGAPQASFEADYDTSDSDVTVTHIGGDEISADNLKVYSGGSEAGSASTGSAFSDPVSAGSTGEYSYSSGDDIRVVYDDGQGNTATLFTDTAP